jgi:transporter family-2 protein
MDHRGLAIIAIAVGGGLVALQAPINGRLGHTTGSFQAAFVSFLVGGVALFIIASLAKGGLASAANARHVPLVYLTGGLMGAVYVTTALATVKTLGAGGVTAGTFAGQLTVAMLVDQFGWFGVEKAPITLARVFGVVLLAAGMLLIVRK